MSRTIYILSKILFTILFISATIAAICIINAYPIGWILDTK